MADAGTLARRPRRRKKERNRKKTKRFERSSNGRARRRRRRRKGRRRKPRSKGRPRSNEEPPPPPRPASRPRRRPPTFRAFARARLPVTRPSSSDRLFFPFPSFSLYSLSPPFSPFSLVFIAAAPFAVASCVAPISFILSFFRAFVRQNRQKFPRNLLFLKKKVDNDYNGALSRGPARQGRRAKLDVRRLRTQR